MQTFRMFLNPKGSNVPLTPYSVITASNPTGSAGAGSSTSGTVIGNSGNTGDYLVASSFYVSTTAGTDNGFYVYMAPSTSGFGAVVVDGKHTAASSPYPDIGLTYGRSSGTSGHRPRINMRGQVTYNNTIFNVRGGIFASTVINGETFSALASTTTSVSPTNTLGGTLVFVSVSVNSATGISISGGEGSGSASTTDTVGSLASLDSTWRLVSTGGLTASGSRALFCYYRSGSTTTPNDITITATSSTDIVVGVSYFSTPEYDTGPIGPPVTPTPTATVTPSAVTPTPTPSVTATITVTPTISVTPSVTPSAVTPTPTPSNLPAGDTGWMPCKTLNSGTLTNASTGLANLDGVYASFNAAAFQSTQAFVNCDGLNTLLISAGATTIKGVEIRVTGYRTGTGSPTNNFIGPSSGAPNSSGSMNGLTASASTITLGSPTTTMGATIEMLTSTNSGVLLNMWAPFGNPYNWYFDYIEMRVYYE